MLRPYGLARIYPCEPLRRGGRTVQFPPLSGRGRARVGAGYQPRLPDGGEALRLVRLRQRRDEVVEGAVEDAG